MIKKKSIFGFIEPNVIMAVIVSLLVFSVGIFAFFSLTTGLENTGISASGTRCYTSFGANPNSFTLPSNTNGITSVTEYYDDGSSSAIDSGNYTWSSSNPGTINVNLTGY